MSRVYCNNDVPVDCFTDKYLLFVSVELVEKRTEVVTQLKYLQAQTEPIVKCFEDPEFNNQIQTTR